ncbi:MAG: hypothetical protein M0R03_00980 [Novosphingobium sp.]|nr:hypothetical protein [Novosphingobium sp.]
MAMFGPRISTVFRSRWNALFWALGIMATAYCSVPSPPDGGNVAAKASQKTAAPPHHRNPWAKEG